MGIGPLIGIFNFMLKHENMSFSEGTTNCKLYCNIQPDSNQEDKKMSCQYHVKRKGNGKTLSQ